MKPRMQVRKQDEAGITTASPPPKPNILQEANQIIYGDRERTYGVPSKNLQVIADFWSVHLSAVFGEKVQLTCEDVCSMMVLLKQARLANEPDHRDSEIDVAGYVALRERCRAS